MEYHHFPIVCSRSESLKKITIVNNDRQITAKMLTNMWNHFHSKFVLEPNLEEFYKDIARPLFEEFVSYKYSQIVCQFLCQAGDEIGITFVKDKSDYICLDAANRDKCTNNERNLLIELVVCRH
jgi:hypothetical protein